MTSLHPAYGLADETRLKILKDAEIHSVAVQSIYNWRHATTDNPKR